VLRRQPYSVALLPLLGLGLVVVQPGCTSQTAIAFRAADAGADAPVGDGPGESTDSQALQTDAQDTADAPPVPADLPDAADALPAPADLLATPDTVDARPAPADLFDTADAFPAPADLRDTPDTVDTRPAPADLLDTADAIPAPADGLDARETAPDLGSPGDGNPDAATILFSDGFEGGYEVNWLLSESSDGPIGDTFDGTNPIVTLDSTQTDYSRLRCNLNGEKFTETDITASMRLRIEVPPSSTRTVRLDVRQAAATANIFYAVGAVVAIDGTITKVSIFKKVPDGAGNYTICELAAGQLFATPIAMDQWKTIRLSVRGTSSVELAAYFQELEVATYTDDCTSDLTATNGAIVANAGCLADQTGIGIQVEKGLQASVDDVLVTTP
jgi:hypothetical protein